ncbi:hypothetical protein GCM10027051_13290 [Niabella terrae]
MTCKTIILFGLSQISCLSANAQPPRIVNIINFIRAVEPREPDRITRDVLYETVVRQIDLMRKHHLGGSFLLQYDALIEPRYQQLLKALPRDSFEIGAWWELPQPLVEKAGIAWRGRFPWDWHADVGFSTGYTPKQREVLIDVYMAEFKKIFGYYPRSVASWFIDAHSLAYMYEKYHIVASANCKDQFGTDGYTLWGGYWNQAYYPSSVNAYMPAQTREGQIPVPIFRMLGSDPIHQYDDALEQSRQGVITLEPVYPKAGGNADWVRWYLDQWLNGPSMAFNYTQAGQENSFTWAAMAAGLRIQFPLLEQLRDQGKIRVETLATSGQWFKEQFEVTPPTAFSALEDMPGSDKRTVWYNSRFYRANLLWDQGSLRFRDIHMFDETMASDYLETPVASNECVFQTLPVMDGYIWSRKGSYAGGWFMLNSNGQEIRLNTGKPVVDDRQSGLLRISCPLTDRNGSLEFEFSEQGIQISVKAAPALAWYINMEQGREVTLPFLSVHPRSIAASFNNHSYTVNLQKGFFKTNGSLFRILPESDSMHLLLNNKQPLR